MWCVGGKLNTRTEMCGYYSGWVYTGDKGGHGCEFRMTCIFL